MKTAQAPALLPALTLAAGVATALLGSVHPALALTLAGLSLGLSSAQARRAGLALGLGLALPTLAAGPWAEVQPEDPLAGEPAELVGYVAAPWTLRGGLRSTVFEAEIVRQRGHLSFGPRQWVLRLPEEVPAPPVLSRLRVRGTAGRALGFRNGRTPTPGPWRLAIKSLRLVEEERAPRLEQRLLNGLRGRVEEVLGALPAAGVGRPLARAMVLGDASELPAPVVRGLKRLGLSHILSVSGLHMSLLALALFALARPLGRGPRLVLGFVGIVVYSAAIGFQPAAWRAALMALLFFVALLLERPPSAANALAAATILLLVVDPHLLADLGFQLSVAATAALVFLAPQFVARWHALPGWLARPLAATAAAQLATLPLTLPRFALLPLLSPVANLILVPWTGVILVVDLAWAVAALIAPSLAVGAAPVLDVAAAPLAWSAAWLGSRSWVTFSAPMFFEALACAVALSWVLLRPRWPSLLLAVTLVSAFALRPNRAVGPEALFLDVGQGDATLLRAGRRAVLIDGGGWEGGDFAGAVLVPALAGEGIRRLDAVALTHGDSDHCQGLLGLSDYLAFGELWLPAGALGGPCAEQLVRAHSGPIRWLREGEELGAGAWSFEVLSPPREGSFPELKGNDRSLVLRARAGNTRLLLTGDLERRAELALFLRRREFLAADVLKVPHHGSRTSSGERFLRAVAPRLAIISAGRDNRYGHPSSEVLARLRAAGARIYRTDRDGAVKVMIGAAGEVRVEPVERP